MNGALRQAQGERRGSPPASSPTRPALRWHGGKWRLAPWIIAHFPPHRVYVEPYGGAASVLLRKPRAYAEVYNDLDDEAVNFFRVLRDPAQSAELARLLSLTPFARREFEDAYEPASDPVERARRLVIVAFQGHGSDGPTSPYRTGFRSNSNRSGTTPAHDWVNYAPALNAAAERLTGVIIENRPATEAMACHDSVATLHYVDPPYPWEVRGRTNRRPAASGGGQYRHELTDRQHAELLAFLATLKGMVVLSGYPCPFYDDALGGWRRIEKRAFADGARSRTEVLWINPAAQRSAKGPLL